MSKWQTATIRWFDELSGEGMVRLKDDTSVFVHYTAVQGLEPREDVYNPFWPLDFKWPAQLTNGLKVQVQLVEDINWKQVSKLRVGRAK